jgi:hypothetical protein
MSRHFSIQLVDALTGQNIITAGGKAIVTVAGSPLKRSLVDKAGAALANPVSLTRGKIEFWIADETVTSADLFIQAPGGQFADVRSVNASGPNEILIDTSRRHHSFVIPFHITDYAANTETSTGLAIPSKSEILPIGLGVDVTAIDAGQTIDVGTLSTDTGDADGFIDSVSLAVLGFKKPTLLASGDTMGALLSVLDSANAGDDAPEGDVSMQGKTITVTLDAGSDTAQGYIHLPYYLAA